MSYLNREYVQRQFENFANRVSKVFAKISDLKAVAFSGKYTDLSDRLTVTNNDLANVPGTAWDAVRGAQIRKDLDKLNSDIIHIAFIDAAAVTQSTQNLLIGTTAATIIPDYSKVDGNILGSILVAYGKDGYETGTLTNKLALGTITRDGNKISKIFVFSNDIMTARARIAVFYTDNI